MCSFSPRDVGALIYGYFYVHVHQRNCCHRRFSGFLQSNVGESGYAISSWSVSAGYSASILTEGAKVDWSSTRQLLAPSVNISADIQHYLIMTQWITLQYLLFNTQSSFRWSDKIVYDVNIFLSGVIYINPLMQEIFQILYYRCNISIYHWCKLYCKS